ncbi:hypothetical protein RHSIM_Rhsim02G0028400 [Rhododendron simsii]|uniref:DUF4005 domain-containing protein n=1 Tax=Rhododendron simsii TaxID=118357 RepID=A0A834HD00_RHOSS|nr:hypothetical protein RHSIM_Rhsim02G0028400 [Rhododendron simsii]
MGKTSKWIRSFLTGKKERDQKDKKSINNPNSVITDNPATTPITIPPSTPREKRRWSFRRSSATNCPKDLSCAEAAAVPATPPPPPPPSAGVGAAGASAVELENEQKRHALAMAAVTAAAADAAVAAAQAAAAVIRLTSVAAGRATAVEEAAAVKIQSVFRSYLVRDYVARKALCALKGLVKLQALVRGHLVRKQATETLRCMQALVTAQARARAQRIRISEEFNPNNSPYQKQLNYRKPTPDNRFRLPYNEMDRGMEENIKIVEMDLGESKGSTKSRNSYSSSHSFHPQADRLDHRFSTHSAPNRPYSSHNNHRDISPSPSAALTETSPRALSSHFEDYSFGTALSSPQYYSAMSKPSEYGDSLYNDHPFFPSYMANTESSRAKARSQSAPKSRPEGYDRQPSRRRVSLEGRNVPKAVRMQRSSSHVGSAAPNFHYPWSVVKLDRSCVSLKDSECGSTSTIQTVQTNAYCRSLVGFDVSKSF